MQAWRASAVPLNRIAPLLSSQSSIASRVNAGLSCSTEVGQEGTRIGVRPNPYQRGLSHFPVCLQCSRKQLKRSGASERKLSD